MDQSDLDSRVSWTKRVWSSVGSCIWRSAAHDVTRYGQHVGLDRRIIMEI